ncbi:M23 family metallopeptidase [Bacillus sp. DTU_2020_1000418_1_SI_GHA_SEK_038]|uniref:M23 family metallopeptidase n=1 Tax=Bacillus sp. DTU_2020_1000418_1_SI_GHA_SEK_038 TaxID=3077585 RepID=UPI0028EBF5E3|nr:M23 family metallopeptidase [Bacillus sp. DTU_2020_1000418_1_SI_GHA_SEK_038]WNS75254.1 M23 family metallopeptidase [Bacillus sp. DTU_2020_1000418_1_SI_GHA_SEK_038]
MREEEKKRSSQNSSFKRFLKKRWAFPAIYIAAAAIILTGVLWYQNANNTANPDSVDNTATDVPGKKFDEPAIEVNRSMENILMPVKDADAAVIQRHFYDAGAKAEEQEAALVLYQNQYHQNTGINIGMKDGETFDVVASLSGTVTKVEEDVLLGNVIEIEHDKGIVTQYQSVKEISVEVGDQVKQGQVIAKAGESMFDAEAGVHVHFEIRKDNVALNPHDYFQKPLSTLQELSEEDGTKASDDQDAVDEKASEEDTDQDTSDEEKDSEEDTNNETEQDSKKSSNA